MSTERDLMRAIVAAPGDTPEGDAPREVYADWLDEQGREPLAACIRAGLALGRAERDLVDDAPAPWTLHALWARAASALQAALAAEPERFAQPAIDARRGETLYVRRGFPARLQTQTRSSFEPLRAAAPTLRAATLFVFNGHMLQVSLASLEREWPALEALHLQVVSTGRHGVDFHTPLWTYGAGPDETPTRQVAWLRAHPELREVQVALGRHDALRPLADLPHLRKLALVGRGEVQVPRDWVPPPTLRALTYFSDRQLPSPALLTDLPALRRLDIFCDDASRGLRDALDCLPGLPVRWLYLAARDDRASREALARLPARLAAMPELRGINLAWGLGSRQIVDSVEAARPEALDVDAGALRQVAPDALARLRALHVRSGGALGRTLVDRLLALPLVSLTHTLTGGLSPPDADRLAVDLRRLAAHPTLNVLASRRIPTDLASPRADLYLDRGPGRAAVSLAPLQEPAL